MKIKIVKDCEVEIAVGSDKAGEPVFEPNAFRVGEVHDVDVVDFGMTIQGLRKDLPLLQFGDGSAGTFSAETFEVLEGQEELDDTYAEGLEDLKETQRRDEKRGLYPDKADAAN